MLVAEAPYDACHYIGQAAPSSLFFQFARQDDYVSVQDAEHYFELASDPKQITYSVLSAPTAVESSPPG
jgi:hypothetical protein